MVDVACTIAASTAEPAHRGIPARRSLCGTIAWRRDVLLEREEGCCCRGVVGGEGRAAASGSIDIHRFRVIRPTSAAGRQALLPFSRVRPCRELRQQPEALPVD